MKKFVAVLAVVLAFSGGANAWFDATADAKIEAKKAEQKKSG